MQEKKFEISGSCGLIRGEARTHDRSIGTVVVCHGFKGFAHGGFFPYLARELAGSALSVVTFDFSGTGIGPDRLNFTELDRCFANTYTRELSDLQTVVSYSREQRWITAGYGLFGHSRGGGVAILHAAADADVECLVTWASISDVGRWSKETVEEWRQRGYIEVENSRTHQVFKIGTDLLDEVETLGATTLNVEAAAARIRVPWLIVHGSADETVPVEEAKRLHAASKAHSTLRIADGGHTFDAKHPLTTVPEALRTVTAETVSFFLKHLQER